MTPEKIKKFLEEYAPRRERTIVVVDFGNVEKWKHNLHWKVGIRELAVFVKHFSYGKRFLRRFYYGADYGQSEKATELTDWSKHMLRTADTNGFKVCDKRVKYIHSATNVYGFEKKCDLDVEMAVDLIRERDNYDTAVIFSGDGDLAAAIQYLHDVYEKKFILVAARGHVGREIIDAHRGNIIEEILYADDLEYRLNMDRNRTRT